jgi:hypothetical protein
MVSEVVMVLMELKLIVELGSVGEKHVIMLSARMRRVNKQAA